MSKTTHRGHRTPAGSGLSGERQGGGLGYQPPTGLGKVQLVKKGNLKHRGSI